MTAADKIARKALGVGAEPFEVSLAGRQYKGWRKFLPAHRPGPRADPGIELVKASWRACSENDIRLFNGPTVFKVGPDEYVTSYELGAYKDPPSLEQVFAIPGLPVLDIIEFCETGNHGGGMWQNVRRELELVIKMVPFEIQLANSASLHATFLGDVPKGQAMKISDIVCEIAPESIETVVNELHQLGFKVPLDANSTPENKFEDLEQAMMIYLMQAKKLRLWWD